MEKQAPLNIIIAPDPVLKTVAAPIDKVDDDLRKFLDDMLETMYIARGVGLAAPQVGISQRILVMDPARGEADQSPQPMVMINPEIIWRSEELNIFEEGCLSLPDYYVEVERPASVRVKYLDRDGKSQEMLAENFTATVLQHEFDHLNGVLLWDYVSKLKRDMAIKKFTKMKKEFDVL
ncbi:MAG TPA: peptide deformylase [Alphaproteobacteria bacterium]|nr:peptide deformylase [Alphaproteobacteria bacterium]